MAKRLYYFLRGMGTVLDLAPDPRRQMIRPLYHAEEDERPELAIYRSWERVGNSLISASGMQLVEAEAQENKPA